MNTSHLGRPASTNAGNVEPSEPIFEFHDYIIFSALSLLNIAAVFSFLSFWISFQDWRHHPFLFSLATLIVAIMLGNHQFRWFLLPFMRRPKSLAPRTGWKVAVATTFTPSAEPLEMLAYTVKALVALDYPHDTWVLDEGDDERTKELCGQLGAFHFSRKDLPKYQSDEGTFASNSKYGNYNAWLNEIGFERYDIFTAFDPDHVPYQGFQLNVLGFFDDPRVGYVQAPQAYYNQEESFIARGAAEETYEFYSIIQMANFGMGYPTIIGCHNTHRMCALKAIGGFAAHDADDLLMTLLYRSTGWEGVYVPKILARGLTPVDWTGYLIQQRRWARSVLDIKLRIQGKLSSRLRLKTRLISLVHGLNYLQPGVLAIASLLLLAIMLSRGTTLHVIVHPNLFRIAFLVVATQSCDIYRQRFYLGGKSERGFHWRARILRFAKWPFILMALSDVLLVRRFPYAATAKMATLSRPRLLPSVHLPAIASIILAWAVGMLSVGCAYVPTEVAGAVMVVMTLILVATDYLNYGNPFNGDLAMRKSASQVEDL